MSAAFARGKGHQIQVYVLLRRGRVQRSTGTANRVVARAMKRMVAELHDAHDWALLEAVRDRRLALAELYDAYASNTLEALRAQLTDADIVRHLDAWEASVRATRGDTGTAELYRWQVERLTGNRMLVSDLTPARISAWLAALDVTTGTRRKNYYALSSFIQYLRAAGVLERNPLDMVPVPKNNPPRLRWEPLDVCQAIVDEQEEPYRTISALIHATAGELGAVLRMVRRDVDLEHLVAHVPGSKTIRRNRYEVIIEPWAKPYLERHLALFELTQPPSWAPIDAGTALLFPGVSRYQVYWAHKQACKALRLDGLTVHDARHSLAVRWRKQGIPLESIAAQLGHANVLQVATIYGRFQPTIEERRSEVQR